MQARVRPLDEVLPVIVVCLAVSLAYLLRFGYGMGFSDQDEFLPWLLARLDPGTLSTDWFVQSQAEAFNVRSGFLLILEPLARLVGTVPAVGTLYVGSALGLITAVYFLSRQLGASPVWASAGVLLSLVLMPRWTLGGNAAPSSMLVPSMMAWALALWAITLLFKRRWLTAGILIGVAGWIQILVAAQVGAMALLGLLWRDRALRSGTVSFALSALTLAAPVVLLLWQAGGGLPAESLDILAKVRAPHHYLPSAFPAADYIQFTLLLVVGIMGLRQSRLQRSGSANRLLTGLMLGACVFVVAGMLAWIFDAPWVLSLQPFKATVLAAALVVAGSVASLPRISVPAWLWGVAAALLVAGWGFVANGGTVLGRPTIQVGPLDMQEAAAWVERNTPGDARIAIPPSSSGFRFASRRAVAVTFKTFPFNAEGAAGWYQRLADWAPGVLPPEPGGVTEGGVPLLPRLDAAYEGLDAADASRLMAGYEVDLMLRKTPFAPGDSLMDLQAIRGAFYIYRPKTR
ncbi:MAG: hypothetical protein ACI80V_001856 [Rhodothermales bacterium]|jgi:hypothetical protein